MTFLSERREQAKRVMKHAATERRHIEKDLQMCRSLYQKLAVTYIDTLELLEGLREAFDQSPDCDSLATGVNVAVEQAWEHLSAADVSTDGTLGEFFDLAKHECIKEAGDDRAPEGSVLRVIRRGIVCNGRRLRSAQVVVNRRRSA
jgi:molecular chaperone GrpE (heat shock protein)